MLHNDTSSETYVGSSKNFALRLLHYIKKTKALKLRLVLQSIRETGIEFFTLRYYPIPLHLQEQRLLIALEQYYIMTMNPKLNSIYVVNETPGGMHLSENNSKLMSVPIYVSIAGVPVFMFDSLNGITNNAITALGASTNSIINCLDTGETFLGLYELSRTAPLKMSETNLMSRAQLMRDVEELRLSLIAYTPPIAITRVSDNEEFYFINFNEARK